MVSEISKHYFSMTITYDHKISNLNCAIILYVQKYLKIGVHYFIRAGWFFALGSHPIELFLDKWVYIKLFIM